MLSTTADREGLIIEAAPDLIAPGKKGYPRWVAAAVAGSRLGGRRSSISAAHRSVLRRLAAGRALVPEPVSRGDGEAPAAGHGQAAFSPGVVQFRAPSMRRGCDEADRRNGVMNDRDDLRLVLLRLSEAGGDAILAGELTAPLFGPVFDRPAVETCCRRRRARLPLWDVAMPASGGLPCRRIREAGDAFLAECPLRRRQDIDLTKDDLRVFSHGAGRRWHPVIGTAAGFWHSPEFSPRKRYGGWANAIGSGGVSCAEAAALTRDGIIASLPARGRRARTSRSSRRSCPAEIARRHQERAST